MTIPDVLVVQHLSLDFVTPAGVLNAVRNVSLSIGSGECLGLVGESGSGKTQVCLATMGLSPTNARVGGSIRFMGRELARLTPRELNHARAAKMAMVFQNPQQSLTPHMRIGAQLSRPLRYHLGLSDAESRATILRWFDRVRIAQPALRLQQYPHQLSGGMQQRAMIAGAMACEPAFLVADEPTTSLDLRVQLDILELLSELKRECALAILLVTHDMGVVARLADRVCVMHKGRIEECGTTAQVLAQPSAEYTRRLIQSIPGLDGNRAGRPQPLPIPPGAPTVLEVKDLSVDYLENQRLFAPPRWSSAVKTVSLAIQRGETVSLAGESGSGKSTIARAIARLLDGKSARVNGDITLLGQNLSGLSASALRAARRHVQIVAQNSSASLDPRMTIGESVAEPLRAHRPHLAHAERMIQVQSILDKVGLSAELAGRYPNELSGGQSQRVNIARAMIVGPDLLICDESVTALDVTIRADILDLLLDLQRTHGIAILFISHDLGVVRELSHRVVILYEGRAVEAGPVAAVFARPKHAYTRTLLASMLPPNPSALRKKTLESTDFDELQGIAP
jgi:ABC-type glutathione transport system ATPase component